MSNPCIGKSGCMPHPHLLLQVDIGETSAPGANVFDESDEEPEASPAAAPVQEPSRPKVNKLAELANKKRKEMVNHITAQ